MPFLLYTFFRSFWIKMQSSAEVDNHFSQLEDQAGRDLYDPSRLNVSQNKEFLDNLMIKAKDLVKQKNYDDAFICFRRYQILLNIIQQLRLFDNNSDEIVKYNEVLLFFIDHYRNVEKLLLF